MAANRTEVALRPCTKSGKSVATIENGELLSFLFDRTSLDVSPSMIGELLPKTLDFHLKCSADANSPQGCGELASSISTSRSPEYILSSDSGVHQSWATAEEPHSPSSVC